MRKLFAILIISVSALSIFAQSADRKMKVESAIRKVMDDQSAAWNRGDIDGFMEGYWKSDKMLFVSGDNVARGWQAAIDRYKKSYDSRAKMGTLSFSGLEIDVISRNYAIVLGSWSLEREKDRPHGKFTLVFKRFKGGWKIVRDHTSD